MTAEGLAAKGWNVAVVCARHSRSLPRYEKIHGVYVYHAPVLARVRKDILSREAGCRRIVELFGGDGYLDAYEKAFRQVLASHDAGAGPGIASAPHF